MGAVKLSPAGEIEAVYGDAKLIPLSSRKYPGLHAIVSEADYKSLCEYPWYPCRRHSGVFTAVTDNPKPPPVILMMHRLIMGNPVGLEIDHINRNPLDNRRENLRIATRKQNAMNMPGERVLYRDGAWDARISIDCRDICLGRYPDKISAIKARDAARLYHYGEFANVMFPDVEPMSAAEIARRAPSQQPKSASGYYGVCTAQRGAKRCWVAKLTQNHKVIHIGYFPTAEMAARAYDKVAIELRGQRARLNFPKEVAL